MWVFPESSELCRADWIEGQRWVVIGRTTTKRTVETRDLSRNRATTAATAATETLAIGLGTESC